MYFLKHSIFFQCCKLRVLPSNIELVIERNTIVDY